jgi:hypothetical protein
MTLTLWSIGNAKVAGLVKDLNLVHLQYNVVAAVFFVRLDGFLCLPGY